MAAEPTTRRKVLDMLEDKAHWVTGGLTFELTGAMQQGALAMRPKTTSAASRPGCLAVARPVAGQGGVRPRVLSDSRLAVRA